MQWTKTTWYQQKCDAHALFRYSTRVKHPGCHLKEGETMRLLTENSTVSQSQKARRGNGRHLRCIHNNYTSTHFLSRSIFHAWYTREESFERVIYVALDRQSELRIFLNAQNALEENYSISTKMWRARTLQVFYTRGTPGMLFKRGPDHACVDWKRNSVT